MVLGGRGVNLLSEGVFFCGGEGVGGGSVALLVVKGMSKTEEIYMY